MGPVCGRSTIREDHPVRSSAPPELGEGAAILVHRVGRTVMAMSLEGVESNAVLLTLSDA
jgi:hypothetical protein